MIKTETQCIYRLFFVLLSTAKLNIFQQICFVSIETTFDRNNLRSKIQGCIDIVRKRYKVCYIDFLLNMSLSKINKSVVTIRKGHFMNSVFVNPGIYSCAVDAFLEISTHLFLPYLSNLRIRNEFTDLLFNVCSHYMSSREDSSLLSEIREPVWSYIINLCSSFTARDCNACFSQIFEKRTFSYLNEEEESLFMTQGTFDSFCSSYARIL